MSINLTAGSLKKLMEGNPMENPAVQIVNIRKMNQKGTTDRYRMHISDGVNSINFVMLGTQLNPKVESGDLVEYSIIALKHTITSKIKSGGGDRKVIIILDCELLVPGSEVNVKIGNPELLVLEENTQDESSAAPAAAPAPTAPVRENGVARHNPPVAMERPAPPAVSPLNGHQPPKRPRMDSSSDANVRPISSINPFQNKWVIKARVTNKGATREWKNARGEGKLFNMDLKDGSGEIRAAAFNDEVDKFFDDIKQGHVYLIGNCTVKPANKKYSSLNHDYELSFNRETFVNEADDDASVPTINYEITPIESIKEVAVDAFVDIVAVCHSCSDVQHLVSRATSRELKKRDVVLVDKTMHSITLTLWGEEAEKFDISSNPIIAIRNARVNEYQNNKNLGTTSNSSIEYNPGDLPAAHELKSWYENEGNQAQFQGISSSGQPSAGVGGFDSWTYLGAVKDEQLGQKDKPDYIGVVATVLSMKRDNFFYMSCPNDECKKKIMDNGNGIFRCEKCDKDYQDFNTRYILNANIADWSGNAWVTLFDDEAKRLLKVESRELSRLKDEEPEEYNAYFDAARFKPMQFKLRVKMEKYNDENRIKTSVVKMEELNLVEYNKRLVKEIEEMRAQLGV